MIQEKAHLHRTEHLDNLLIFQARYQRFQFDKHAHEEFSLGLMEHGTQKFSWHGTEQWAPRGSLITINPDEIHDGMSADSSEYRYRILFIPDTLVQNIGREMVAPKRNHWFNSPVITDQQLAVELAHLLTLLDHKTTETLEQQTCLYMLIAHVLARHGTERNQRPGYLRIPKAVQRACEYINDVAGETVTLENIASVAGLSRFHFLRLFRDSIGMSPYGYLLHRRLQLARHHITQGMSLAEAALISGFSDQSHMSRRFKAAYGITPGQYQKAVR